MRMSLQLTLRFVTTVAIAALVIGANTSAKAQAQDLNGIFFPRSSEEFFQAGVQRLEDEVQILQHMNADEGDRPEVLQIDESVAEQQDTLEHQEWIIDDNSTELRIRPDEGQS